ncbi:MAG: hypothetical protein V3G42_06290 [Oscillospiraceae bacterium]
MKKLSWVMVLAILLTGCGSAIEPEVLTPAETEAKDTPIIQDIDNSREKRQPETEEIQSETEAVYIPLETEELPTAPIEIDFSDFDSIPEEKIAELALDGFSTAEFVKNYHTPRIDRDYTIKFVPENEDFESYLSVPEHFTIDNGIDYVIDAINPYDETDLYSIFEIHYTDSSQESIEYQLFPKNFYLSGNNYAYYTGGTDEKSVLQNFDLLTKDKHLIWRGFKDDPEMKCIAYDFYSITQIDGDTAELGWYCYLIDRNDFLVNLEPEWNLKRTVKLSNYIQPEPTVSDLTKITPENGDILTDIHLRASQSEITVGEDDNEVIWYAEVPPDCLPETVALIDESTGEKVADLYDLADYEQYGDTIQGDSVYNCRFKVNVDIDTDPDVSEDAYYHYYAEFADEKGIHRSEPFQIWVLEQFTDKELNEMEIVDNAVSEMLNSNDFQKLTTDEKLKFSENRLHELEKQGYILKGSIHPNEDSISFQYSCGIDSAVMLEDFGFRLN